MTGNRTDMAAQKTAEQKDIMGITLLKCSTDKGEEDAINNYRKMVGFLENLRQIIRNGNFSTCKNYDKCKERLFGEDEEPHCTHMTFVDFSTMMGHFDFIVSIKADSLNAVEGFWLICLREASRNLFDSHVISDTQTLLGVIPADKVLEDCSETIKPLLVQAKT